MLYYLPRTLLFIILVIIAYKIITKKNIINKINDKCIMESSNTYHNQKKLKSANKKVWLPTLLIIWIITFISFYPIEGSFLRFNSPEQSLSYSIVDNSLWKHYIIEDDDACFVYSRKGSNVFYHTISKYEDGFGMIDYKSSRHSYDYSTNHLYPINCHAVYDSHSDLTCYFLNYGLPQGNEKDNIVKFNNKDTKCIYYKEFAKGIYTIIEEGEIQEHFTVTVNGVDAQF